MRSAAALAFVLLPVGALAATQTMRAELNAKRHAIPAGRHFAVEAGMRLFRENGNAFDAGVAAVLAASVSGRSSSSVSAARRPPCSTTPGAGRWWS